MSSDPKPKDSSSDPSDAAETPTEFELAGADDPMPLHKEFWLFIRENKAWWMVPIVVSLLGIGLLVAFGSTGAAPFIYTLF